MRSSLDVQSTGYNPFILDAIVNDRPMRRKGMPNSNRSQSPAMAPHGIWRAKGNNEWVSIAIRDDNDWEMFAEVINQLWANDERWRRLVGRLAGESELERLIASWVQEFTKFEVSEMLRSAGIPCGAVLKPIERIEDDRRTEKLWVEVEHSEVGVSRVEGLPLEVSETNWHFRICSEQFRNNSGRFRKHIRTILGASYRRQN